MAPTSASLSRYGQNTSAPITGTIWTSIHACKPVDANIRFLALGCCLSAIAVAFVPNGGCARKSTSIWLTGGSVDWVLNGDVPDHSTFSKNRHGRFRESDLLRLKSLRPCEASDRELDRCEGDEGGAGIGKVLVVLCKATVSTEPRESALDHPATTQHDEAFHVVGSLDDFDAKPGNLGDGVFNLASVVAGSGPLDEFEPGKANEGPETFRQPADGRSGSELPGSLFVALRNSRKLSRRCSAARSASAQMVAVGLTTPLVARALPSTM
jgi:hypothetical protein